jgi:hypothetical protein
LLDYWAWLKGCKRHFATMFVLVTILTWMTMALVQADRQLHTVVREIREGFRREAAAREALARAARPASAPSGVQPTKPAIP